eukprot:CAMPEP_0183400696 /NCGR_PEP_ID=MMETSP0370-20130417/12767_1 /TAXON_ID=268820 /ORGANISM="Peridinium aciculiferum, Strain PAER-2" /LENGTH=365 /DNA_ID=CAMNT_0025582033 /DNA_START=65 /DNA_END=1162 /DNA_ORIENTATION=-
MFGECAFLGGLMVMRLLNERAEAAARRRHLRCPAVSVEGVGGLARPLLHATESGGTVAPAAAPQGCCVLVLAPEANSDAERGWEQALGLLPLDLLSEVARRLPCKTVLSCIGACRCFRDVLERTRMWECFCKEQWPGAYHHGLGWRHFAYLGGGDLLGRKLLEALKTVGVKQARCPVGHSLSRFTTDAIGFTCDCCAKDNMPRGAVLWGCRDCNFDKCEACYRMSEGLLHLLAVGAKNTPDEEGWTALHHSCRLGFPGVAERLLDSRANVESKDRSHGYTPLMVGVIHGDQEVCSLLLRRGARKQTRNSHGRCALDVAQRWGRTSLEPLLRHAGEEEEGAPPGPSASATASASALAAPLPLGGDH